MALKRDTAEWLEARRGYITSSSIPILLGLSNRCEQDLADEMAGVVVEPDAKTARMFRLGHALEAVIRAEDQIEHGIKLRNVRRFIVHPNIPWAATSADFERVGERCIVEAKSSRSREWDDGLPWRVEAQCRWQMGVADYPHCHVAALRYGSELECLDLFHDPAQFEGLLVIAEDFWNRYQAGGPFTQSADSIKRRYPTDNGAEMVADLALVEQVRLLLAAREARKQAESDEADAEQAIKARMGEFAGLVGPGFRVSWKRTKDQVSVDWKAIAEQLLSQIPEPDRAAIVGQATTVRPGFRPLRVTPSKEA